MSRNKWIAALAIISILTIAFLWGGDYGKSSPQSAIDDGAIITDIVDAESGKVVDDQARIEEESNADKDDANASSKQESEFTNEQLEHSSSATDVPEDETVATDVIESTDQSASGTSVTEISTPSSSPEGNISGKGSGSSSKPVPTANSAKPSTTSSAGGKTDKNATAEVKPDPVEWQDTSVDKEKPLYITLSVSAATILDNLSMLDESKLEVLPKDGIIYAAKKVLFYEGESVFDVLLREMKNNKIHMEFEMTPLYNSNYIEGIHNLYEFDCGELSGWMYSVNGWFPNYGSSRYSLQDGDIVEWLYTCDLGRDVGGYVAPSGASK